MSRSPRDILPTNRAIASRRGERPRVAALRRSMSLNRLEVVLLEVVGDLIAEHRSLRVGDAEMDACPHAGIDDLLERV